MCSVLIRLVCFLIINFPFLQLMSCLLLALLRLVACFIIVACCLFHNYVRLVPYFKWYCSDEGKDSTIVVTARMCSTIMRKFRMERTIHEVTRQRCVRGLIATRFVYGPATFVTAESAGAFEMSPSLACATNLGTTDRSSRVSAPPVGYILSLKLRVFWLKLKLGIIGVSHSLSFFSIRLDFSYPV